MFQGKDLVTFDFETYGINAAPDFPPKPVGLAIKVNGKRSHYYAWGHASENNSTEKEARAVLSRYWRSNSCVILGHNSGFDHEVAVEHWNLPPLPWKRLHDTLFLAFLLYPRHWTHSLKPLSEEFLNVPSEEQDRLMEWILENVPGTHDQKRSKAKADLYWPRWIHAAPGKLAGKYARGDVDRTYDLFRLFYKEVKDVDMVEPYDRERRVQPVILDMEHQGVPIDYWALLKDTIGYTRRHNRIMGEVWKRCGVEFNLNSGDQMLWGLAKGGYTDPKTWPLGKANKKTGKRVALKSEDVLKAHVNDAAMLELLLKQSTLSHMLSNFCDPWLNRMESYKQQRLYPSFNQVRHRGEGDHGTRTGRLSSTDPNFQQLNRLPDDPTMPFMRKYLLPEEGHVLLGRDYNQQELRIAAHYEQGALFQGYLDNPRMDTHDYVKALIEGFTGREWERNPIKRINFGKIYGMGREKLAAQTGLDLATTNDLSKAHRTALPGLYALMRELSEGWREGYPLRTRGGRLYYSESDDLAYKALNTLIQGSAADHTKEATPRIASAVDSYDARILLQVHDEFLVTAPKRTARKAMRVFRDAMDFEYFELTTPSDGKVGDDWGNMRKEKWAA